jgi:hypothetical protein
MVKALRNNTHRGKPRALPDDTGKSRVIPADRGKSRVLLAVHTRFLDDL